MGCDGKTKLPLFVRVAKALEIPYIVLADHDIREIKAARKKREEERNKEHLQWTPSLRKWRRRIGSFF